MAMRLLMLAAVLAGAAGCTVSRTIIEVQPPEQPPLQDLDRHLDYVDPDAGRLHGALSEDPAVGPSVRSVSSDRARIGTP